jgi:hypothetical protein
MTTRMNKLNGFLPVLIMRIAPCTRSPNRKITRAEHIYAVEIGEARPCLNSALSTRSRMAAFPPRQFSGRLAGE